jgi:hypothetical protein
MKPDSKTPLRSNNAQVWIKTNEEKLLALLADEAKQAPILQELLNTIQQLKAKNTFRIAIINQLIEDEQMKKENK